MAWWLLSFLYVGMTCLVAAVEVRRSGKLAADVIGIFILVVTLQCVLPGIVTYALFPIAARGEATGMDVFDHIYNYADPTSGFLILALTIAFIFFVYVGAVTTRRMLAERFGEPAVTVQYEVQVVTRRLGAIIALGILFTVLAFYAMGDSFVSRYANLILLRSVALEVEQTALASNALALAQAWSWLTIVALFAVREQRGRTVYWQSLLVVLIAFALFGVSRRAIFLPIVFAYLIHVMSDGNWRFGKLVMIGILILPVLAFGKEILGAISYGGAPEQVEQTYGTVVAAGIRTSTDVGVTVTESLGTVSMIDLPPRFGADHALSVLQRFPEGVLGIDIEFPERMVRKSTAVFADEWTVDIPPGLFGQMWLDFRVFGPVIWGLILGMQVGLLQYAWERLKKSRQAAAVMFLSTFIVALPINSGSFDFTFSVDIILVVAVLFFVTRVRPAALSRELAGELPVGRR